MRTPGTLSSMDAVTRGTLDGLQLLLAIVAMLIVLIALVTLVNLALGLRSIVTGTLATLMTGAVVGMLI